MMIYNGIFYNVLKIKQKENLKKTFNITFQRQNQM